MKAKFTTLDIKVLLAELQQKLLGMRVNNVYDVDSKTYLIKLNRTDEKAFLLIESGIRFHTTEFEWPKNIVPSGFAMKLRKHLRGRRLESVQQLGVDRIVDMQFGSGEAAYHVILEVYDRGNIVLTDHEYTIINIQRPRANNDQDVKFAVKEKYPLHLAKQPQGVPLRTSVRQVLEAAKNGDNLRKVLNPHLVYGSHLLDHCLLEIGMKGNARLGTEFEIERDLDKLMAALQNAEEFMSHCTEKLQSGYIINQKEKNPEPSDKEQDFVLTYSEFHPYLFKQHSNESYTEFESFDKAVDEFFSKIETQKQDRKVLQQRNTAMKKLEHIKLDNLSRIKGLKEEQLVDLRRAWLIELNLDMVDEVILMLRNALAHQLDWSDLKTMLEEESLSNDVVDAIKSLRLDVNHITMLLKPPAGVSVDEDLNLTPMKIDIDLSLSAYANARRFYGMKKHAAVKEAKTIDSLQKAYKSAEKKTMKTLKEVQTVATINKARKVHWFEKFLWFISSENYMVVGGRDQQQNEVIVKRYMKPGDIYVHADLHGASSVIIKNPTKNPIPPVTLNEAGSMALCNSAAWDSRVVASSWWVYHDQVSKTAPTGEYLTTGSFMIRGKKNYLLPSSLIYGFGFLFKLDESCIEKHKNERRVRGANDEDGGYNSVDNAQEKEEEEIVVEANEDESDDDDDDASEHKENGDMDGDDRGIGDDETESKEIATSEHGEDVGDDDDEDEEGDNKSGDDEDDKLETVEPEHTNETEAVEVGEAFPDTDLLTRPSALTESDVPDSEAKNGEVKKHTRLSAKQKRDAKKKKNGSETVDRKETVDAKTTSKPTTATSKPTTTTSKPTTTTSKPTTTTSKPTTTTQPSSDLESENSQKAFKRGQRSKLKKIKQKYKDQDEEERELRMQLLASNGPQKPSKPTKKDKETEKLLKNAQRRKEAAKKYQAMKMSTDLNPLDVDEEPDEEDNKQQETEVLDSLTGIPQADDILHYCIPVCAPWNALINYRFKVKLLPGTSKKGKAARTLVESFIRDKNTTSLEKDLFRSVKDHDLSKNLPGKVKMIKSQKK